jgi:adenylate cyclase
MPEKSNKFDQFWQELKRRKTARVIVIYGATAFVILQLTDIITPALLLPGWTNTLIILLLAIGFPFAVIFSWIFDITPEGIRKTKPAGIKSKKDHENLPEPAKRKLQTGDIIIAVLLVIVAILAYPKVFQTGKTKVVRDSNGKISIVVNTFENLTGDTNLNSWCLGISELLINNLGTSKELSIQNSQTMSEVYKSLGQAQNASVVPSLSKEAAIKLKAGTYITGNFIETGNKIRILAKLIDTKSDELLWTGKVDGNLNSDFIELSDSLSKQVKNFLEIKALEQNSSLDFREAFTNSADAYRKYIEGMNSFMNADYLLAIQSYKKALEIDSTFTFAAFYIAYAYKNNAEIDLLNRRKSYRQIAYGHKKHMRVRKDFRRTTSYG